MRLCPLRPHHPRPGEPTLRCCCAAVLLLCCAAPDVCLLYGCPSCAAVCLPCACCGSAAPGARPAAVLLQPCRASLALTSAWPWCAPAQVIKEKGSNLSRGYGFVSYAHPVYSTVAMQQMNQQVGGRSRAASCHVRSAAESVTRCNVLRCAGCAPVQRCRRARPTHRRCRCRLPATHCVPRPPLPLLNAACRFCLDPLPASASKWPPPSATSRRRTRLRAVDLAATRNPRARHAAARGQPPGSAARGQPPRHYNKLQLLAAAPVGALAAPKHSRLRPAASAPPMRGQPLALS